MEHVKQELWLGRIRRWHADEDWGFVFSEYHRVDFLTRKFSIDEHYILDPQRPSQGDLVFSSCAVKQVVFVSRIICAPPRKVRSRPTTTGRTEKPQPRDHMLPC